ncbi:MAG TPA: Nramp family divalent metal transporter [Acidimicrobiales bacterium]|nr:Nramp family divalent metal transporter [Acidimicrobiales bacterium]
MAPTTKTRPDQSARAEADRPPRRWAAVLWFGPGLIWMISSVGSGSVLFTPRVGSRFGYALLWLAVVTVFLMWAMIKEVGRYTVVTGRTILDGFRDIPGPRHWALWAIFLPQLAAAVVTIAGIASLVGSALVVLLPGPHLAYAIGLTVVSAVLVVSGRYHRVERITIALSGVLVAAVMAAAASVAPRPSRVMRGMVPAVPDDFDLYFVLPWVGFILAGAAGIMWFSYWVAARGFGGPVTGKVHDADGSDGSGSPEERTARLQSWNRLMTSVAAVGTIGGGLVIVSFLILGTELLRPEGLVPEGIDVARDLSLLLSEVWGQVGEWLLIVGVVVALWGTILANQDGWGRTFADATIMLTALDTERPSRLGRRLRTIGRRANIDLCDRATLKNAYAVVATTAVPVLALFLVRDPVEILSVGGIIAAVHTPVVVALVLTLNRQLPAPLRPTWPSITVLALAGLWYGLFAAVYLLDLVGLRLT